MKTKKVFLCYLASLLLSLLVILDTSVSLGQNNCDYFSYSTTVDVDCHPLDVQAADFNNDGVLDLVTISEQNNTMSVLIGLGNGNYANSVDYPIGNNPVKIAPADFNDDGFIDLAVANNHSNDVAVIFNNGDGTFASLTFYALGTNVIDVVADDYDLDGDLDFAAACNNGGFFRIYLNDGFGVFTSNGDYPLGVLWDIESADLNGDGYKDLVSVHHLQDKVKVSLNNTDATFATPIELDVGDYPQYITVGDINEDDEMDILASNYYSGSISILYGNGSAEYEPAIDIPLELEPDDLQLVDWDQDEDLDLAICKDTDKFMLLLNNGSGTFVECKLYTLGIETSGFTFADLNGNGNKDFAVCIKHEHLVTIYDNNYQLPEPYALINIDRSGSMFWTNPMGQSRLERAKEMAHIDVEKLLSANDVDYPDVYKVAVMYFNATGIVIEQDFTTDPILIHNAIDAIPGPKHDTPLAAAMCEAHCSLDAINASPRLIFTYTDGLENVSQSFPVCSICEPCNELFGTEWYFDCDPNNPSSCSEWQICLFNQFIQSGVNLVKYFGEPINPFDKDSNDGLEDMFFLKASAEASAGEFWYFSDRVTVCGDANSDGTLAVSDAIWILNFVFANGEAPSYPPAANVNCDNQINVSDAVTLINYIFGGGEAPCDCHKK